MAKPFSTVPTIVLPEAHPSVVAEQAKLDQLRAEHDRVLGEINTPERDTINEDAQALLAGGSLATVVAVPVSELKRKLRALEIAIEQQRQNVNKAISPVKIQNRGALLPRRREVLKALNDSIAEMVKCLKAFEAFNEDVRKYAGHEYDTPYLAPSTRPTMQTRLVLPVLETFLMDYAANKLESKPV